jgi:2-dehydro-3-deoxyphosphogluconate aldolase / (4S)-4-hydroxy-2-oxoglutarate aldolase
MKARTRTKVIQTILDVGIVPVFYQEDPDKARKVVDACVAGGLTCIEMTNRGVRAHHVFRSLAEYCAVHHPHVLLGAGTVQDQGTAALYIQEGAAFVVAPYFDLESALVCNKRRVPYFPGCSTATEIHTAETYGAEICKIFPGSSAGGPGFVKAILGPSPASLLMPTGGVEPTRESLTSWFKAGVACVGLGSQLIPGKLPDDFDYTTITEKAKNALAFVRELRGE